MQSKFARDMMAQKLMSENKDNPFNSRFFQPSDALSPPRYTGLLLPIERDMFGEKGNFEFATPRFVTDAISGINKFGQAMRGQLSPEEIQKLAFDTSLNVTGGTLLGSKLLPNAIPRNALAMGLSSGSKATKAVDDVKPGDIAKVVAPTDESDGIFAFHGSGADFDEFKLSKIGTGEGNQAFGYGLYFTDSEDIAKFYKNQILRTQNVEFNGKPIKFLSDSQDIDNKTVVLGKIRDRILGGKFNSKEAIDSVKSEYQQTIDNSFDLSRPLNKIDKMNYNSIKSDLDYINTLDAKDFNYQPGKIYEVKIKAVMDDLIDYDKSLRQQNDKVKKILKPYYEYYSVAETADFGTLLESAYRHLPQDEFSERLAKEGIKGIKYQSGQLSGIKDSKATNFVIFDDKIIDIMKKYGIVGAVGVTAMQGARGSAEGDTLPSGQT